MLKRHSTDNYSDEGLTLAEGKITQHTKTYGITEFETVSLGMKLIST